MDPKEYRAAQVRRVLMALFTARARRHLKTLAEEYKWSPETLAAHEERFIVPAKFLPVWDKSM